jgi:hypothetical protein
MLINNRLSPLCFNIEQGLRDPTDRFTTGKANQRRIIRLILVSLRRLPQPARLGERLAILPVELGDGGAR